MKGAMVMFFVLGAMVGYLIAKVHHQTRLHEQIQEGVERTIEYNLSTDGEGTIYYHIDK